MDVGLEKAAGQLEALRALIDTLVPDDEFGPGGLAAGVDHYVIHLCTDDETVAAAYSANLAALDRLSNGEHGRPFAELDLVARTELLAAVEAGDATAVGCDFVPDPAGFFGLAHEHMLQGMFGDPVHGGNRDLIGWKLLGYRGIKLKTDPEDQRIGPPPERPVASMADITAERARG